MHIDQTTKDKLAKIRELIMRGATEGERAAAQLAWDRIMQRFQLTDASAQELLAFKLELKFRSEMEERLLRSVCTKFAGIEEHIFFHATRTANSYTIGGLNREQHILATASYEYFKADMLSKYQATCGHLYANEYNTAKRLQLRAAAQKQFVLIYMLKSGILSEKDVTTKQVDANSTAGKICAATDKVAGGKYRTQLTNNKYIG